MSKHRVAEEGVRKLCIHRHLNDGENLAGAGAETAEAENLVVLASQKLHEPFRLRERASTKHHLHWNGEEVVTDPLLMSLRLC